MRHKRFFYIILVSCILVLGAFFRMGFPNVIEFKGDEESALINVPRQISTHSFPLFIYTRGIPMINAVGIFLLPFILSLKDPRIITIFAIGFWNFLAVVLCYLYCRSFFNKEIAIVAGAIFSFSIWAIIYSRKLWGCSLLQFFSILAFYLLTLGLCKKRPFLICLSLIILLFLPSFHLTSFSIHLTFFILLCIIMKRMGFFLLILLGIYLILRPINIHGLGFGMFSPKAFIFSQDLLTWNELLRLYVWIKPPYRFIELAIEAFLRILFLFGFTRIIKAGFESFMKGEASPYLIIGLWYIVFCISFGLTRLDPYGHYFLVIFPTLAIIPAIGFYSIRNLDSILWWEWILAFSALMLWNPVWGLLGIFLIAIFKDLALDKRFLAIILFFVFLFQIYENLWFFRYQSTTGGRESAYGVTLGRKMEIARFVIEDARDRFNRYGLRSYCTVEKGEGYNFLLNYYLSQIDNARDFFSFGEVPGGFHYIIEEDKVRIDEG